MLSADYKAQRRTTQDLVDFFKSGPPPSPPRASPLTQMMEEEGVKVKKKNLFSRLKSRKSSPGLNEKSRNNKVAHANDTTATTMSIRTTTTTTTGSLTLGGGFGGSRRSSVLTPLGGPGGTGSSVSTGSGMTVRNNNFFNASQSNPNHPQGSSNHRDSYTSNSSSVHNKKYVMIAVDYRDVERGVGSTGDSTALASGASSLNAPHTSRRITGSGSTIGSMTPRRHSRIVEEQQGSSPKRTSLLTSGLLVIEGAGGTLGGTAGDNKRRSIIIQSNGESSKFALEGAPLFLDSFALNTDFITQSSGAGTAAAPAAASTTKTANDLNRSASVANKNQENGVSAEDLGRNGSKRASNKVKFNVARLPPMDEASVTEALEQRLASHKVQKQLQVPMGDLPATEDTPPAEVVLPKTTPRKKVRHVQIQTTHCVVRPMYTQTEPVDAMDVEPRVRFSHGSSGSVAGTTEIGTSTSPMTATFPSSFSALTKKESISMSTGRPNSKVASLVASLTQPTAATTATTTTLSNPATLARSTTAAAATTTTSTSTSTSTSTDGTSTTPIVDTVASTADLSNADSATLHAELQILRQQNGQLQTKLKTLERHLAAETRARTRTAVAMQDTREKFEMLSAMAYKKLKEMIFQRHVLELEVQELRARVDLNEAGASSSPATLPTEDVVREGERLFLQQQQPQAITV